MYKLWCECYFYFVLRYGYSIRFISIKCNFRYGYVGEFYLKGEGIMVLFIFFKIFGLDWEEIILDGYGKICLFYYGYDKNFFF